MTPSIEQIESLCASTPWLGKGSAGSFSFEGKTYDIPRYTFVGPDSHVDPMRVGLFATLHGDEPEALSGLVEWVNELAIDPSPAKGYQLYLYPVCNPVGLERKTRENGNGKDLNREFWKSSSQPEVCILERELWTHSFKGIVSLHSDDTSTGLYGFVGGTATLTKNLLVPALLAAEKYLPVNRDETIDGFGAQHGIIESGYTGILTSPPEMHPRPFEIVFETPQKSPLPAQLSALKVALTTMLNEYRSLISIAQDI
ncbi:MAG: succinylglutamate desuccinylase/aspartoacylase family protein [Verrucomicrobiota bacterium]|nr:succinylglutamate desuccinylase/aspartoacylase family protein [Verrucomicrobiota bacterium]